MEDLGIRLSLPKVSRLKSVPPAFWAIGSLFFLHGFSFATWSSRIPTFQNQLHLSEAELGNLLLAIPLGTLICMPISGILIHRYGSRRVSIGAILSYGLVLSLIGPTRSVTALFFLLAGLGSIGSLVNVSLNTQGSYFESKASRPTMTTFHGFWSLSGFLGAALGAVMIAWNIAPSYHFLISSLLIILILLSTYRFLLPDHPISTETPPEFSKPKGPVLRLGLIAFCAMLCEGAMFDWSGVYFDKVIHATSSTVGLGYVAFMVTMSATRFVAGWMTIQYGISRVLINSGIFVFFGFILSVIYPNLLTGILGFFAIGIGTSPVVPLVMGEAAKLKHTSASRAIALVSTISFSGFLVGPPLIGWIATLTNLRFSFLLVAFFGLGICFLTQKHFRNKN